MNTPTKTITVLIILLIISTSMAIYGFMSKGPSVAPITAIMYNKEVSAGTDTDFNDAAFWDNYPYWILLSDNKSIDPELQLKDSRNRSVLLNDILNSQTTTFFRYTYNKDEDSLLAYTFRSLQHHSGKVAIIADEQSVLHLKSMQLYDGFKPFIYLMVDPFPIPIEKVRVSYFFKITSSDVGNIYVPRKEIPEMTDKYLTYITTNSF
jgi:hypothetical protein